MRLAYIAAFIILTATSTSIFATTYYVKSNGSDASDGLSHASAWKSINKVNSHTFQPGDDVYFQAGDVWNKQIIIDWSGTETNRVIIGSYYMSGESETTGVPANTNKPTFNGTYKNAGDPIDTSYAVPSSQYAALIQVSGNYVTVQNIRAVNSSGVGITLSPKNGYHHAIFENNEVDGTAGASMTFQRTTHSNIMRNNKMRKCDLGWRNKDLGPGWAFCNGAVGSRNNIMEGNLISESYGEGIVAFDVGSVDNIIRNNTLIAVRSAAIYVDNGVNTLVENNIVIGEQFPSDYTMNGGYNGGALNLNVEDYKVNVNATGNIFRNNLVANVYACIGIGMDKAARAAGYKVGGKFIGNTCVNTKDSVKIWAPNENIESIEIANNIFLNTINGQASCATNGSSSNANFRSNYWDLPSTDTDCNDSRDVIGGLTLNKTFGWANISIGQIPLSNDFTPIANSPVLKMGMAHNDLLVDYYGVQRSSRPDMGAIQKNGSITTLAAPRGLSLSITNPL